MCTVLRLCAVRVWVPALCSDYGQKVHAHCAQTVFFFVFFFWKCGTSCSADERTRNQKKKKRAALCALLWRYQPSPGREGDWRHIHFCIFARVVCDDMLVGLVQHTAFNRAVSQHVDKSFIALIHYSVNVVRFLKQSAFVVFAKLLTWLARLCSTICSPYQSSEPASSQSLERVRSEWGVGA